jgi:hypothetical protein
MMKNTKYLLKPILFGGLLFAMFLPLIQQTFSLVYERDLEGAFTPADDVKFSVDYWFSGDFQDKKEAYLNENFGFRTILVRLYNQIGFSVFNVAKSNEAVVGQSDVLFLDYYIKAYYGTDFLGEEVLKKKVDMLASVRDSLKSNGVDLLVFLAPGKGSYFPEYAPEHWNDSTVSTTNYEVFSNLLKSESINVLDAKAWFEQAKDTSSHPLYPKTGIHWSKYAEYLVLDTVMRRVENIQNIKLPKLILDSLQKSSTMRDTDDDIERSMNLLFDIEDKEMTYPYFHFQTDSSSVQPNVLTIGDSYYWGVYHYGLSKTVFDNSEFWYYFETISPAENRESNKVKDLDLKLELEKTDMVILWLTESNVYSFGFIETAYQAYNQTTDEKSMSDRLKRIAYYSDKIIADPEWYAKVKAQAVEKGISIEQSIRENAEYMVFQESLE